MGWDIKYTGKNSKTAGRKYKLVLNWKGKDSMQEDKSQGAQQVKILVDITV